MDIDVRLETAPDRGLIEEFYVREGLNFQQLVAQTSSTPVGASIETMFVVAVTRDLVVAALKLDVAKDPGLGKVGFIKHFEIEDALESTVLGKVGGDKLIIGINDVEVVSIAVGDLEGRWRNAIASKMEESGVA